MKRKRIIWSIAGLLLTILPIHAQQAPDWINGFWEDLPNSYIEVVSGDGANTEDARNIAVQNILKNRSLATGQRSNVSIQDGFISVRGSDDLTVKARIIDSYFEYYNSGCRAYLLVQVLRNPSYNYESVYITNKYPFSARVFVPGMAQIYKGQVGKGVGFITGEIAFIGGIVVSECLRQSYDSKVSSTHSNILRKDYADKANICQISRNVSIAGAAALYLWNIIDGAVSKGKKHVVIGSAQLQFAPYIAPETGGLAFNLKF